jgi:hypothetical protein
MPYRLEHPIVGARGLLALPGHCNLDSNLLIVEPWFDCRTSKSFDWVGEWFALRD